MKNKITLGLSGAPGSFSEEAALLYAERADIEPELKYLIDMQGVLAAIAADKITRGIFPVANTQGGLVKQAFQAMGNYLFTPIDELWLDVQQCLLILPGAEIKKIKRIASHSQALSQCKQYIKTNFKEAEIVEWIDTAQAAKDLAEGRLTADVAVIAPERAAKIYNLDVFAKNIQDAQPNLTAFIVVTSHREQK